MDGSGRRLLFDGVEVSLAAVLVAAVAFTFASGRLGRLWETASSAASEGAWLKDRYGPRRYSRSEEEWIIRDYFQDRRGGVFVDVGANHYKNESNTFYLETILGWSGVAVDPQESFAAGYRQHRPRTQFFAFFVSDESDAFATLYELEHNSLVASSDRTFAERGGTNAKTPMFAVRDRRVPTVRLTDLLDRLGIAQVDLLSVDVELAEPKVLAGFEITKFQPALVCIEGHPQVRQQILDYFAANRYVLVGKYLRVDLHNLYFARAKTGHASAGAMPNTGQRPGRSR